MAGIDLSKYHQRRDDLIENISQIKECALYLNNNEIINSCNDCEKQLLEDVFNIVVVGEFSRGKSMFINALLGKKILPSSVKPTTAILNRILYSEKPTFDIEYKDEPAKTVSEEEFLKICAPKEPDQSDENSMKVYNEAIEEIESIEMAKIGYPLDICKNGIQIIDTPGINDTCIEREEITNNFIEYADVAILLLSATQILTAYEMKFIKEKLQKNNIDKIFLVINFKDKMKTEEDRKKVIDYAKENLKGVINNPKIVMVSSKDALNFKRDKSGEKVTEKRRGKEIEVKIIPLEESGFSELESELSKYLSIETGRAKLTKHIKRVTKLIDDLDNKGLSIHLSSLDMNKNELEDKVNTLKNEIKKVESKNREVLKTLKTNLLNAENELKSKLETNLRQIAQTAEFAVIDYDGELDGDLISQYVQEEIEPLQSNSQDEIKNLKEDIINKNLNFVNDELKDSFDNLGKLFNEEFNMEQSFSFGDFEFGASFGIGAMLGGGMALIGISTSLFIVAPLALLSGVFMSFSFFESKREKYLNKVKKEINKKYKNNIPKVLSRFNKDWKKTVKQIVKSVEKDLDSKVKPLNEQLNNIINERNSKSLVIEQKRTELLNERTKLQIINNNLINLQKQINN